MDWKGIEWVVPLYELLILLVPIYGFIVLRRRVKRKELTKARGFLYYSGLVISPIVMYSVFIIGITGIEEMLDTAIVSEGLARSFFLLVGIGLIVWLISLAIFGIALAFMRNPELSPKQANTADAEHRRGRGRRI
jgi:hypothetical protein